MLQRGLYFASFAAEEQLYEVEHANHAGWWDKAENKERIVILFRIVYR